jgi:hypothetical protein
VNDDRLDGEELPEAEDPVEDTGTDERVVVHVEDNAPELCVPAPVPELDRGETLESAEVVADSPVVLQEEDEELVGGHNVTSEPDDVWEPDWPLVVGVIVRVCTLGEPVSVVVHDVEMLKPDPLVEFQPIEPELAEDEPDFVTVRMLGSDGVALLELVEDDPGTVYVMTSGVEVAEPAVNVVSVVKVTTVEECPAPPGTV